MPGARRLRKQWAASAVWAGRDYMSAFMPGIGAFSFGFVIGARRNTEGVRCSALIAAELVIRFPYRQMIPARGTLGGYPSDRWTGRQWKLHRLVPGSIRLEAWR